MTDTVKADQFRLQTSNGWLLAQAVGLSFRFAHSYCVIVELEEPSAHATAATLHVLTTPCMYLTDMVMLTDATGDPSAAAQVL